MILFRFHRGSYKESMATARPVKDISELGLLLALEYNFDVDSKLSIKHLNRIDSRNGWDTHIVAVNDQVVGYLNQNIGYNPNNVYNLLGQFKPI